MRLAKEVDFGEERSLSDPCALGLTEISKLSRIKQPRRTSPWGGVAGG